MKGKRKAAVGGFLLVSLKTAAQPFCWEAADGARSRMEQMRPFNVFSRDTCLKFLHYEY